MDEAEAKRRSEAAHRDFIARIRATEPERAYLYCDHGSYIGYGGLFQDKCEGCLSDLS